MNGYRGGRFKMGGPRRITPGASAPVSPVKTKRRVLFVCIGNSCRSQMAEGFARTYGADVMIAASAGTSPAANIAPLTRQVLAARNVRIDDHFPKDLDIAAREPFDLIVNMSGQKLPLESSAAIREWSVRDPIGEKEPVYQAVAEQIEGLVMRLILELRSA
jgi:protein-tyrosine-phosphatase